MSIFTSLSRPRKSRSRRCARRTTSTAADRVGDHRHQQPRRRRRARTSSTSQEGSCDRRAHRADAALAVEHRAALELVRPPLAVGQAPAPAIGAHGQRQAAQRLARRSDPRRPPGARSAAAPAPARRTIVGASGDRHLVPPRAAVTCGCRTRADGLARHGADHVEAAVQAVRPSDAAGRQRRRRRVGRGHSLRSTPARSASHPAWNQRRQSTMSTTTRRPLAGGRRLQHRAQRLRGAPAAADDLAVVVGRHCELQHDRAVILVELLDRDLLGPIDEAPAR